MKAAIIGYGKSGAASEKLLKAKGYDAIEIFDDGNNEYRNISEFENNYDTVVVSPGIDRRKYKNLPEVVTSEIELAYELMDKNCKVIGVTGTNGKSTVTHLTAQILNNAGFRASACGNIGYPFGDAVLTGKYDVFVIELSSFQLELLKRIKIDAGCIINVTPDHMDRYDSMDDYYNAKMHLMNFIDKKGLFVSNPDTKIVNEAILKGFKAVFVEDKLTGYPKLHEQILSFKNFSVNIQEFTLFGYHNVINLAFALLLADNICNFQGDRTDLIRGLSGMNHRSELVADINGVRWINDSKATNVDSVITALKSLYKPSILLLGGKDKNSDYTPLIPYILQHVSEVCFFGEAAEVIREQISKEIHCVREINYKTLEDCVKDLVKNTIRGYTVLLSPACASFDEFQSFEDRGEKFVSYIEKYVEGIND